MLKFTTALTLFMAVAARAAGVSLGAVTAASNGVGEGGLCGSLVADVEVMCRSINDEPFACANGMCNQLKVDCAHLEIKAPPYKVVSDSEPRWCYVK